jgi:hypothetical protein
MNFVSRLALNLRLLNLSAFHVAKLGLQASPEKQFKRGKI